MSAGVIAVSAHETRVALIGSRPVATIESSGVSEDPSAAEQPAPRVPPGYVADGETDPPGATAAPTFCSGGIGPPRSGRLWAARRSLSRTRGS